jgi:hypothetical protein
MPEFGPQIWCLGDQKRGLGLYCAEEGLFLGGTPLLERQAAGFIARQQSDLETVLSRGFGFSVSLDRVIGGLTTVASALNAGELCRARIAAGSPTHSRSPGCIRASRHADRGCRTQNRSHRENHGGRRLESR